VPDVGTLARLPHLTSNGSLLAELTLTARDFDAQEAKELGLVSRVVCTRTERPENSTRDGQTARKAVLDEALRVASQIARLSPVATAGVKKVLGVRMERR
jgi:delta(3,5)-delta(2,4)-dienoyl-CoA isomerase